MTTSIDGSTRLHVIVGDPIAQVKSPGGLTAAFAAAGHNAVLVPIHVTPADLRGFVAGLVLARNLDGIVATVPHKFACYELCTETSERARFLKAVNIMRRTKTGGWYGDMSDGEGFVAAMRKTGFAPQDKRALLVGAGGAGSAMALALIEAGVRELAIHDVDAARRTDLIARLKTQTRIAVTDGSPDPTAYDLIANATPLGMRDGDPLPIDVGKLTADKYVGCVVTAPAVPPLIAAARQRGCKAATGTDMFLGQQQIILDFLLGKTVS